ncbi:hypothetical protein [Pseudomonas sp. AE27]|uniref:hypothetical protein n=1 Tax=Pseudomonas sp. AE27 TaxID=3127460 RepID=UPI0030CD243F
MNLSEDKLYKAHERHARTLTFLVYAAFAGIVFWLDGVIRSSYSSWAEGAYFLLYIVSFFAIFAFSSITEWFYARLSRETEQPKPHPPLALHFKDAKSVMEYSCKYMDTSLRDGECTPCIVISTSSSKESGSFAVIDYPTGDGLKRGIATFPSERVPQGVAGKLCAALIGPPVDALGPPAFLVFAELEPSWIDGAWQIKTRFS